MFLLMLALAAVMQSAFAYTEIYPDNPLMAAEWKWNYAQTHKEQELAAADVQITDYDIQYARGRLQKSEKDCEERGGVWCDDFAATDRSALKKLQNVKAQQTGTRTEKVDGGDGNFLSGISNGIRSAFDQLVAIARGLFGFD